MPVLSPTSRLNLFGVAQALKGSAVLRPRSVPPTGLSPDDSNQPCCSRMSSSRTASRQGVWSLRSAGLEVVKMGRGSPSIIGCAGYRALEGEMPKQTGYRPGERSG
jgi:hypothetical protein